MNVVFVGFKWIIFCDYGQFLSEPDVQGTGAGKSTPAYINHSAGEGAGDGTG